MDPSLKRCAPPLYGWMILMLLVQGCSRAPYTPVEPTAEQLQLKEKLAPLREEFKRAYSTDGDYAFVAVLDRDRKFDWMDKPESFTQLLILHREQLDLDDYHFSQPGKEASEDGQIETVLGEFFWVSKEGEILFDESNQPPETEMVVEWFVPSGVAEAALHFGGNPCLTVPLKK
jgi:hypothetical protein